MKITDTMNLVKCPKMSPHKSHLTLCTEITIKMCTGTINAVRPFLEFNNWKHNAPRIMLQLHSLLYDTQLCTFP